jgi:hypothetical protein
LFKNYDILIKKGRQASRQGATNENQRNFTISLINNTNFDNQKIANIAGVTVEYVRN